ncbi:MAG: HAMP domain-containing protein [Deltaproteobacteria bacterium]|nr:HAMP domain-containing protein [Deltaproteobacteria bacterium]
MSTLRGTGIKDQLTRQAGRGLFRRAGLNSIQARLTFIALFFIVATALTMGGAGYRFMVQFESERFRDHFSLLASYLAGSAELGVLLGNEQILAALCDGMLKIDDVQWVQIVDRSGNLILRRSHPVPAREWGVAEAPVMSRSLAEGESLYTSAETTVKELGRVAVGYSLGGLDRIKRQFAQRFVFISLLLSLAPVAMYWGLSRAINAPLRDLVAVAKEVSRGHMDVRAAGGSLRESRALAGAINEMLDALETKRRELDEANAAMARQQALAEVGKFSMIVAHEIKNPLAIIKGSLDILRKEAPVDPELKRQMAGYMDEEIGRINKLIEDFLLYARPRTPVFEEVPVRRLIADLKKRVALLSDEIRVSVTMEEGEDAVLRCDAALLERALLHVVRNALDVAAGKTPVDFDVLCFGGRILFMVQDRGPGVRPEDAKRIFEPFFSTKAKGTGLGLAIAREVVTAHGGNIRVGNRPEGGACFSVRVPLSGALPQAGEETADAAEPTPRPGASLSPEEKNVQDTDS